MCIDITDDVSGKLEDLRAQVGGDDGKRNIARDAVDAILHSVLCTIADSFVHYRHVVEFVRPELEEYSAEIVERLLEIMAKHRATKVGQKPRNLEHFHEERRTMQNENDEGRYPTGPKEDGGVPKSSTFACVSKKAHKHLSDMMGKCQAQGKDTSVHPFPSSNMISRIGCTLSWHIHHETFKAMALVLDPIKTIVAPKSEDFVGQEPDPGSKEAGTLYDVMGWIVVKSKMLRNDLHCRERLTDRQQRFLQLLDVWNPNAQMSREEAEKAPRLSTDKVSDRSDKHNALEGAFVTQPIYELGWRLEHTINQAIDSGALTSQGAGDLFVRIESTLMYDPFFLRLLRLTLRGASAGADLVRFIPPKDVPESIADILDYDVWVDQEPLIDLWRFILSTYLRMRGKDFCGADNNQRGGKQAETDKMSHRSKVRSGESSSDSKSSGKGGKSVAEDDEQNEAFIKSLEENAAEIDNLLFPEGVVDGTDLPPPATSTDDEGDDGLDDDANALDPAWFASDDETNDADIDEGASAIPQLDVLSNVSVSDLTTEPPPKKSRKSQRGKNKKKK